MAAPTAKKKRKPRPAAVPPPAIEAVKAEATGDPVTAVTWRDQQFYVAATADDWPVDVLEAFESGKAATALAGVLGPAQWERFKTASPQPKVRDLTALMDSIASKLGFSRAGELPASCGSCAITRDRWRPTSPGAASTCGTCGGPDGS
jgi:hypothetical protein